MKDTISIIIVVVVLLVAFASCVGSCENQITVDDVKVRFQEITGTDNIEIIRYSNTSFIFGDPFDMSVELRVDGKYETGRCVSGEFSSMVCRLDGQ